MAKKRKRTLKIKKREVFLPRKEQVYPKKLYKAFCQFINEEDEEVSEMLYETRYKPLQEAFLGEVASDRMEQCNLAQRLSALKLRKQD